MCSPYIFSQEAGGMLHQVRNLNTWEQIEVPGKERWRVRGTVDFSQLCSRPGKQPAWFWTPYRSLQEWSLQEIKKKARRKQITSWISPTKENNDWGCRHPRPRSTNPEALEKQQSKGEKQKHKWMVKTCWGPGKWVVLSLLHEPTGAGDSWPRCRRTRAMNVCWCPFHHFGQNSSCCN